MSRESFTTLADHLQSDVGLRDQIHQAASLEEVLTIAQDAGFDITIEDLTRTPGELSETELDAVAGAAAVGCSLVYTFFCPTVGSYTDGCGQDRDDDAPRLVHAVNVGQLAPDTVTKRDPGPNPACLDAFPDL